MSDPVNIQRLREYFAYDADAGVISWKRGHGKTFAHAAGTRAFTSVNSDGYYHGNPNHGFSALSPQEGK